MTATQKLTLLAQEKEGPAAYVSYEPFVGFFLTIPDAWEGEEGQQRYYRPAQTWHIGRTQEEATRKLK